MTYVVVREDILCLVAGKISALHYHITKYEIARSTTRPLAAIFFDHFGKVVVENGRIANVIRAKLNLISVFQGVKIQRERAGKVSHVLALAVEITRQLCQGQIVRIKRRSRRFL